MARLKFYENEYKKYADYWMTRFNQSEALKICNKLNRHYKLGARFYFSTNRNGYASYDRFIISLPKNNIALAMICHEIGHLLCVKIHGYQEGKGHHKKLAKINKKIFAYAKKYLKPDFKCYDKLEDIRLMKAEKRGFKGWNTCSTCKLRLSSGYNIQGKLFHLNCIPLIII